LDEALSQTDRHVRLTSLSTHGPADHPSVYIGLRDVDEGEKRLLRENGIRCFTMHEVDKYGIGKVMEMALDHVMGGREMPLHLSFDVDALDPTVAPSKLSFTYLR
jgi:arginase family enzyme